MNLREQLRKALARVAELKAIEGRDYTDEELKEVKGLDENIKSLREQIESNEAARKALSSIASVEVPDEHDDDGESGAKSRGPVYVVREPGAPAEQKSLGESFVSSDAFKAFRKAHAGGVGEGTPVRIEAKGIGDRGDFFGTKATITTATGQVPPVRQPGYRSLLEPDLGTTLLDLISTGTTEASVIEYAQVIAETNGAGIVPEGDLKPLSDVTTALKDAKAYTYADGFDVTNQVLADDGALAAFMDSRIRTHVRDKVEDILLNGAGTATEPAGILATTGVQQQVFDTDVLTTLARSLEKAQKYTAPQAIVMHPTDAWNLRLLKNSNGDFYAGGPFSAAPFMPWGVPLALSYRITQGTALVGNFRSINFLEREPLNVLAFNQHKDYAQRNMVYVRAELRGMQLFYAPREVVVADLTAA